jgi:hypothetical protein
MEVAWGRRGVAQTLSRGSSSAHGGTHSRRCSSTRTRIYSPTRASLARRRLVIAARQGGGAAAAQRRLILGLRGGGGSGARAASAPAVCAQAPGGGGAMRCRSRARHCKEPPRRGGGPPFPDITHRAALKVLNVAAALDQLLVGAAGGGGRLPGRLQRAAQSGALSPSHWRGGAAAWLRCTTSCTHPSRCTAGPAKDPPSGQTPGTLLPPPTPHTPAGKRPPAAPEPRGAAPAAPGSARGRPAPRRPAPSPAAPAAPAGGGPGRVPRWVQLKVRAQRAPGVQLAPRGRTSAWRSAQPCCCTNSRAFTPRPKTHMGSLTATTPGHTKESDGAHLPPRLPVLVQPLAADELQHEQAVGKDVHRLRVLVVQVALGHDTRAKAARRQHRQPQVANLDLAAVAVDVDLVQPGWRGGVESRGGR